MTTLNGKDFFMHSTFTTVLGRTFAVLSVAMLGACATTSRSDAGTGGETAAKAAAFRYLFADNASALKTDAATYCIGTGPAAIPTDPDPALMAALADVRPTVQPISACRTGDRVTDAAGRPALIFHLETTECDGTTQCFFRGGYYEGNVGASTATYRARLVGGRWQVTQEGATAIS